MSCVNWVLMLGCRTVPKHYTLEGRNLLSEVFQFEGLGKRPAREGQCSQVVTPSPGERLADRNP